MLKSNDLEICCYTYIRRVKRREGKPQRVCQSRKGSAHSPLGRLGKNGTCRSSQGGLATLKVRRATGETPPTTEAFLYAHLHVLVKPFSSRQHRPRPDHNDLKRRPLWLNQMMVNVLLLAATATNSSPVLQKSARAAEPKDPPDAFGWHCWSWSHCA